MFFIPLVSADAFNPPDSVTIAGYISTHNQIGIWWLKPNATDFDGTQIWFDNVYIGTTSATTQFYYAEFLSAGDHTLSTHTIDTFSNINPAWANLTVTNNGYFTCEENWYCDNYCSVFGGGVVPPKEPKTPIDPANITKVNLQ